MKFREDYYEEDDDLIMAMRELNQRRKDLKITFKEFISVLKLSIFFLLFIFPNIQTEMNCSKVIFR